MHFKLNMLLAVVLCCKMGIMTAFAARPTTPTTPVVTTSTDADMKEVRWGTSTALLGNLPTSADSLRKALACGFDYIEVDVSGAYRNVATLKTIKRNCDATGMKIWSVHLPYGSTDISSTEKEKRETSIANCRTAIQRVATIFGKDVLMVLHASYEPIADSERPKRLANAHAAVVELQAFADKLGATICVENLPRTCLGNTPEELLEIIKGTNAKICYDTNHYTRGTIRHFIATAAPVLRTVHFSDFDFGGEMHWTPGQGQIPWGELMHLLKEAGYKGVFMSEALKDRYTYAQTRRYITVEELQRAYQKITNEYEQYKDPAKRLAGTVDEIKKRYFPDRLTIDDAFTTGTDPGFYPAAPVATFKDLYTRAAKVTTGFDDMRHHLLAALDSLVGYTNPVTPGYYWIQTASSYFLDLETPVNMAMYSDGTGLLKWKKFEPTKSFLFKVEPQADGFSFQCMGDKSFIGANSATSQPVSMTTTPEHVQYVGAFGQYGNVYLFNDINSSPYHALHHGMGKGRGSNVCQYPGVVRSASAWYLRRVNDATVRALLGDDATSAITLPNIDSSTPTSGTYAPVTTTAYDISGRRVAGTLQAGLYVLGHRKVFLK